MKLIKRYVSSIENRKGMPGLIKLLGSLVPGASCEAKHNLEKEASDAIPYLISAFGNPHYSTKIYHAVVEILVSVCDERHIEDLIRLADTNSNSEIVTKLLKALGRIGGEKAYSYLTQALKQKKTKERDTIAEILASTNDPRFIAPLSEALEHWYDYYDEYDVGRALYYQGGALSLAKLGGTKVVPLLLQHAAKLNARLAPQPTVFKEWAATKIMEALAATGTESVEILITTLNNHDPLVRTIAAGALGHLKDRRAAMPLIQSLRDQNAAVREYAARSLGEIGDVAATDQLRSLLNDSAEHVRKQAQIALGILK